MAYGEHTDEDRRRAREMEQLHFDWSGQQIAAGMDGPVPPGRRSPSDYNQHVPDLESSGAAQDEFHTRAREIMGLPPLEAS
jgi:hypothetical protein